MGVVEKKLEGLRTRFSKEKLNEKKRREKSGSAPKPPSADTIIFMKKMSFLEGHLRTQPTKNSLTGQVRVGPKHLPIVPIKALIINMVKTPI